MAHFINENVNVVGMYFKGIRKSSDICKRIIPGQDLHLRREPWNKYDKNAVLVVLRGQNPKAIGYIKSEAAARLAPILDRGSKYDCVISKVFWPKGTMTILATLTTFPIPRGIPRKPSSPKTTPIVRQFYTPTGVRFRAISDFKAHFSRYKNVCGIYVIWNNKNRKCYIGQSIDIGHRFSEHYYNLVTKFHSNKNLQKEWLTFGERKFRFDILERSLPIDLNEKEKHFIEKHRAYKYGYNSTEDGQGREQCPNVENNIDTNLTFSSLPTTTQITKIPVRELKQEQNSSNNESLIGPENTVPEESNITVHSSVETISERQESPVIYLISLSVIILFFVVITVMHELNSPDPHLNNPPALSQEHNNTIKSDETTHDENSFQRELTLIKISAQKKKVKMIKEVKNNYKSNELFDNLQ